MTRITLVVLVALVLVGLVACGSDEDDGAAGAEEVFKDIKSLREGEILIKGSSSRVYGPYSFDRPAYDLNFEHASGGRLVVALASKRTSEQQPFQLVVDTAARRGTAPVTVRGRLYVDVRESEGEYVLRFTPRRPGTAG